MRRRDVGRLRFALLGVATVVLLSLPAAVWAGPIGYSVRSDVHYDSLDRDHLYSIDLATGAATDLGLVGLNDAQGLAFVGNTLYGIGCAVDEFWDITTPPGFKVGNTGPRYPKVAAGLAYNTASGMMYNIQGGVTMLTYPVSGLYRINVADGVATYIGNSYWVLAESLAISATGVAYTAGLGVGGLHTVNLATGSLTLVGGVSGFGSSGMSFDAWGMLWALDGGNIYTVDTISGVATFVAAVNVGGIPMMGGFESLAIPTGVIPEPTTLVLLGTGLAGLVIFRRKRRLV